MLLFGGTVTTTIAMHALIKVNFTFSGSCRLGSHTGSYPNFSESNVLGLVLYMDRRPLRTMYSICPCKVLAHRPKCKEEVQKPLHKKSCV